ncbi:MAG: ABC transporter ATP-binding protein [Alphaproteobacteria bacterium]|nr:ABC transporter ATP-binding protein [Alphaproteobacteria bacterium]
MSTNALEVCNLRTRLRGPRGDVEVLRGIDLVLRHGEVLGLIGESGSGKTMTGLSILRLAPRIATVSADRLRAFGLNLLEIGDAEFRALRGRRMAMVFQDPVGAFNPAKTVGWHFRHALRRVADKAPEAARDWRQSAIRLLGEVGIPQGASVLRNYAHQLSGGMLQRALIAIVLACRPELIVADEPTTNLDAIVERQILSLFRDLQRKLSAAFIYITHDIAIAAQLCDRIAVIYAGQIVEEGPTDVVFGTPKHPYTQGLLGAAVALDKGDARLQEIRGDLPNPAEPPPGCLFAPRCSFARPECAQDDPGLRTVGDAHSARCVLYP